MYLFSDIFLFIFLLHTFGGGVTPCYNGRVYNGYKQKTSGETDVETQCVSK